MGAARFSIHCSKSTHWGCGGEANAKVTVRLGLVKLGLVKLGLVKLG